MSPNMPDRPRTAKLLDRALTLYERALPEAAGAMAFLRTRGIADPDLLQAYRVGFCPGGLVRALPRSGFVLEELCALGLIEPDGTTERLAGCLVFPVLGADGQVQALLGIDPRMPERVLCVPERGGSLWNAPALAAWPERILTACVLDALALAAAGLPNVAACLDPEGPDDEGVATLLGDGAQSLLLLPPARGPDLCGWQARLHRRAGTAVRITLCTRPGEESPAALASCVRGAGGQTEGSEGIAIRRGSRLYRVLGLDRSGIRSLRATVRAEFAGRVHVDTLDLYAARSRQTFAHALCRLFAQAPERIEADLSALVGRCERERAGPTMVAVSVESRPETARERAEAEAFGRRPDLVRAILADFTACGLVGEETNKLLCYLAVTSRLMPEPLCVLIVSGSGAGKSVVQEAACGFVPPEDLVSVTSLSGKALFYRDSPSLRHKVLAIEEAAGAREADYALRSLISEGSLRAETAVRDPATGRMTTRAHRVEGPTAVLLTTSRPDLDPEMRSRFLVTGVDESRDQTRAILAEQRRREGPEGLLAEAAADAIRKRHHLFQRMLRPVAVVNPFHARLGFCDERLERRRDQPKYLGLIRAAAFLRQMHKPQRHLRDPATGVVIEYVEADRGDLRLAHRIACDLFGRGLDELSRPGRSLLFEIEAMVRARPDTGPFTRREIREHTGWSHYRVHTHIEELVAFEYLATKTDRDCNRRRYRLLWDGQGRDGGRFVIGLRDPS